MKELSLTSLGLVAGQMVLLALILAGGPLIGHGLWLGVEVAGLILGAWALWAMRRSRFSVAPNPRAGATLVENGPYAYIRHPMYTAVLLVTLALVGNHFTWGRAELWLLLLVLLLVKLNYEERLLADQWTAYRAYQTRTRRLLPFVY